MVQYISHKCQCRASGFVPEPNLPLFCVAAKVWFSGIDTPTGVYAMRVPSDDVVYEVDILIVISEPEKGEGKR